MSFSLLTLQFSTNVLLFKALLSSLSLSYFLSYLISSQLLNHLSQAENLDLSLSWPSPYLPLPINYLRSPVHFAF